MVELNFDVHRPETIIDVSQLPELRVWRRENGAVFLGSGVTYARIVRELAEFVPLAEASRTIGSPQIRNRGTVGGNLGTASPAGDAIPPLAVYDAEVVVGRAGGSTRSILWREFTVGVKKTTLRPEELILGTRWKAVRGPGSFSKIGVRNAMIISVAGLALQVDEDGQSVRVALGSVAPTIVRASDAEVFIADELSRAGVWEEPDASLPDGVAEAFGERVAASASPIDDVRGTAAYRRHACAVLARRALSWALQARRGEQGAA
jgi:CO/xanthine dehydrogenase FAD-binding subunit